LDYLTLDQQQQNNRPLIPPHQICITTLSDSPSRGTKANVGGENTKWWFFLFFFQTPKCRDFSNVAERTRPNMRRYARTHGYTFMDHNRHQSLLDTSRPPAWSKIKAVQYALDTNQCRYVLWLDADVVITNSTIRLEQIIPYDPNPMNNNNNNNNDTSFDIIVTSDRRFTANSGVWIISNSTWSRSFLDQWWNMRNYVRAKGLSLSGDNDAFGALIRKYQQQQHVHMLPARCHLNSFGVFVPNNSPPSQFQQNVGSTDFYHAGDFIAHASGIDQKDVGIQFLLQRAQS
jgi:mannan polymerase II complex MNN10 subunit